MADIDIWFLVEVGFILGLMVAAIPTIFLIKRFVQRNHVWYDLRLESGRVVRKKAKPESTAQGVFIQTKYHPLIVLPYHSDFFKGLPLFRYRQGDPYPIRYDTQRTIVKVKQTDPATGKEVEKDQVNEITIPRPAHVPGGVLKAALKTRLIAQMYGEGMAQWLVIGAILILMVLMIGLYLR